METYKLKESTIHLQLAIARQSTARKAISTGAFLLIPWDQPSWPGKSMVVTLKKELD